MAKNHINIQPLENSQLVCSLTKSDVCEIHVFYKSEVANCGDYEERLQNFHHDSYIEKCLPRVKDSQCH